MASSAPVWRLPIRCLSRKTPIRITISHKQRRLASDDSSQGRSNPVLDEYRRNNPEKQFDPKSQPSLPETMSQPGDIAAGSIFEDERRATQQEAAETGTEQISGETRVGGIVRDPNNIARLLNPKPHSRERYERRKVIQLVKKGGRLTPTQFIKRTEREHLSKSHNFKTSIKKLGMLARQIQGKTLEEAIVQMRFSNKKVAQDVLKQLEFARDEAVVTRGMGLGKVAAEGSDIKERTASPIDIQLKDGKRHRVEDPSKIYIEQAWVGRGPYGKLPDYRARGRVNIMRTPWTSISLKLKEEATRVREWQEREAKRQKTLKEKVWRALPDRPIQIRRNWYSW